MTVDELVEILSKASDQYHNEGDSFLTDEEYDKLFLELKELDPTNLFLTEVGSDVRGGKIDLPYPMGSLDQCYEGETLEWVKKNGWEEELFVVSDKQDGTSALNIHTNGRLKISYSRGNGFQGADITRHMSKISHLQSNSGTAAVRCEVIMPEDLFHYQKEMGLLDRDYKNSRNYVAGKMNASESPELFYSSVKVIGTSVIDPKMGKQEQFEFMESMGYEVTPYKVVRGKDLTDDFLEKHLKLRRIKSPTAIDGLVIDLDDAELRSSLRSKSSSINPPYSRKYKLGSDDNVAIATVVDVHWRPSKTGYLKPRVEIEPVDLVGVTITFATGFNAKFIRDNNIGPGAKIQITRSGDVIPFIQRVVEPAPHGPSMPKDENIEWTEGEVDLYLLNADDNPEVQIEKISSFFGDLDVPFLRKTTVEKLYDYGFTDIRDFIYASEEELQVVVGESSGTKIFNGIKEKLNPVELGILAGSASLLGRGIGRRKMKKLCTELGDECILNGDITLNQILTVEGFQEKTANTILKNLPEFLKFLEDINGYYTLKENKVMTGDLEGLVVVFTGIRDKELQEKIEARGGKIGSGVSKTTTHLVAKDPFGSSSKLVKARELLGSDRVISITEARELWG